MVSSTDNEVNEPILTEMSNEEIIQFIEQLRERRRNVSLKKLEERVEKAEEKKEKMKKKDTFAGDSNMNSLLDDILGDLSQ